MLLFLKMDLKSELIMKKENNLFGSPENTDKIHKISSIDAKKLIRRIGHIENSISADPDKYSNSKS